MSEGPGVGDDSRTPAGRPFDAPAGGLTAEERRVLEAVDASRVVERTRALVRIPTHDGDERAAQELMAEWMASDGLDPDVWEIDLEALAEHPAYSAELERDGALGVVGLLEGPEPDAGPTLVLNGHVDVVPPGDEDEWSAPPFSARLEGSRIVGRGACDMKGGLVAALEAVRAVGEAGPALAGRVRLQSVVGEEDGGTGTLAAVLRGHVGDGAVVLEPTRLAVVTAQAGALNFRIRVRGRAAHGALRTDGVSAVEKFEVVHRALRALEVGRTERLGGDPLFEGYEVPFPISVGRVRAGDWPSSVPGSLVAEGRYGVAVGEDPSEARAELEAAVADAASDDPWLREHPPSVEWWGGRFEPASTDPDDPLVRCLVEAHEDLAGSAPSVVGVPYGADMRLLVNQGGTPTVCYGPGDVRLAHGPDESVEVGELMAAARAVALLILRFCGRA